MKEGSKLKREDGRIFEVTFLSHWSDLVSVVDGKPIEKHSAKWFFGNQLISTDGKKFTLLKEDGTPAEVV
jgi:hypothetical protein